MRKRNHGITLVALVVTIIILLILAGISIASLTNSGLFEKARDSEIKSIEAKEKEEGILSDYEEMINGYLSGTTRNDEGVSKDEYAQLVALVSTLSQKVTNLENKQKDEIGTIIAYSIDSVPNGYLKCEGQAVSRTEYSDLFAKIGTTYGNGNGSTTFNIPDLRGEFLRGTGTNSHKNQGMGSAVGVHQDATEIPVFLTSNQYGQLAGRVRSNTTGWDGILANHDAVLTDTHVRQLYSVVSKTTSDENEAYAYSSRPTNTSVLYCIKY